MIFCLLPILTSNMIKRITTTTLPTKYGEFVLHLYNELNTGKEHLALVCGDVANYQKNIPTRIHSACLTGEVFGSLRCDCQEQLRKSMEILQQERIGVLIYLNQEGRGIGLTNKIKAYALQDQGLDTAQANEKLGYQVDARDYAAAALILKDLGVKQVLLLTNNPQKIRDLKKHGFSVKRQALWLTGNSHNYSYIMTKKIKMGHLLDDNQ